MRAGVGMRYLRAGSLPKKATNVMKETKSTRSAIVVKDTIVAVEVMVLGPSFPDAPSLVCKWISGYIGELGRNTRWVL